MKITLAQLNPTIGDIHGNLTQIEEVISSLQNQPVDLVIFPELFITGYPPRDLLEHKWLHQHVLSALNRILEQSTSIPDAGLIIGIPHPDADHPGKLYNSAILCQNGKILFTQHKSLLPNYDVFDEARYFQNATDIRVIPFKNEILGISICEDAWATPELWKQNPQYHIDPVSTLARQGATLLINISASPFYAGKDTVRYQLLREHTTKNKIPFIYVNQVGCNDELIFDGQSMVFNSEGQLCAKLPAFIPALQTLDLVSEKEIPFTPLEAIASIHDALVLGIRDYFKKCGFQKAVIGLSGGIDSAVTCALATQALGPENVVGVTMPSMYSSEGSQNDSYQLADKLKITCHTLPIAEIYQSYITHLTPIFAQTQPNIAEENIQARIRGNLLMAFSNKFGHILLSTGNKSELAVGYCTMYGDMSGGLSVISDVPKTTVYKLAEYINRHQIIIPENTITKPPSAELKPDQTDQDTLPPYDILDGILYYYLEELLSSTEIINKGYNKDVVNWVIRTVNRNEYKRRQAAPGFKVTTKAFGMGRRIPIAARFEF